MNPLPLTAGLLAIFLLSNRKRGGTNPSQLPSGLIPGLKIRILDMEKFETAKEQQRERINNLKNLDVRSFTPSGVSSRKARQAYDWQSFLQNNPELIFVSDLTLVKSLTPYASAILKIWSNVRIRKPKNLFSQIHEYSRSIGDRSIPIGRNLNILRNI